MVAYSAFHKNLVGSVSKIMKSYLILVSGDPASVFSSYHISIFYIVGHSIVLNIKMDGERTVFVIEDNIFFTDKVDDAVSWIAQIVEYRYISDKNLWSLSG